MNWKTLTVSPAALAAALVLSSCGLLPSKDAGEVVRNPTVEQMALLEKQWGTDSHDSKVKPAPSEPVMVMPGPAPAAAPAAPVQITPAPMPGAPASAAPVAPASPVSPVQQVAPPPSAAASLPTSPTLQLTPSPSLPPAPR